MAEALGRPPRPSVGRLGVEEVHDVGFDVLVVEAEVGDQRIHPVLVHVGEDERSAGVGEALGNGGAEATAGAGDGDHAAVQIAHAADATGSRWRTGSSFGPSWA